MPGRGPVRGEDGRPRCPWALSAPEYVDYHDDEWGRPLTSDDAMFERMSLEGFQSGLSWLVILRKRPAFRIAFADFSIPTVAGFDGLRRQPVARVTRTSFATAPRSRRRSPTPRSSRIYRVACSPSCSGFAPTGRRRAPRTLEDLPAKTPESIALAKALHGNGVKFVGPTTAYALMQATGLVNDHLVGCIAR